MHKRQAVRRSGTRDYLCRLGPCLTEAFPPRSYPSLLATRGTGSCFCSRFSITQTIEKVFPGEISHGPLLPDCILPLPVVGPPNFSGRLGVRSLNGDGAKDSESSLGGYLREIWLLFPPAPNKFAMKRVLLHSWLFGLNRGVSTSGRRHCETMLVIVTGVVSANS